MYTRTYSTLPKRSHSDSNCNASFLDKHKQEKVLSKQPSPMIIGHTDDFTPTKFLFKSPFARQPALAIELAISPSPSSPSSPIVNMRFLLSRQLASSPSPVAIYAISSSSLSIHHRSTSIPRSGLHHIHTLYPSQNRSILMKHSPPISIFLLLLPLFTTSITHSPPPSQARTLFFCIISHNSIPLFILKL